MKKPVVALVGRPNVGKSTIFNRLVGSKISIIEDTPGVTRDRIYGNVKFNDYNFHLIDTGGIDITNGDFNDEIKIQASIAIDEADLILFIVDGKEGLTTNDYATKDMLLKSHKEVIVVVNKCDSKLFSEHQYDFYELGFENILFISGEQNTGIFELLDLVTSKLPKYEEEYQNKIKFSIIGRPNVGKSSLVNAILNEERAIVSNIAGTYGAYNKKWDVRSNKLFVLIDLPVISNGRSNKSFNDPQLPCSSIYDDNNSSSISHEISSSANMI